ncbi:MAG TPA: twin-arginine translocase TatA/TatE family subunit [Candidatus Sulfotelmatobacter sp.]|nr:twin-arginine translocase TatA/TatE family subunit [Candidatus Sulfotelmatobacter sp.]
MLSIPHLIIIFVVVLVVFGPEKLPELARNLGKVMAEFRKATGDLRMNFEDHLRDLERETEQRRIGASSPAAAAPAGTVTSEPPKLTESASSPGTSAAPASPDSPHADTETGSDGGTHAA